jgi:hypothetical protein
MTYLNYLLDSNLIYIYGYLKRADGKIAAKSWPLYAWGEGKSVTKPPPLSRPVINKEYRERTDKAYQIAVAKGEACELEKDMKLARRRAQRIVPFADSKALPREFFRSVHEQTQQA